MKKSLNKTIISKCPLRLGLAGGGTDVDPYRKTFGGHCITASISLYAHCRITKNTKNKISFNLLDKNFTKTFNIDDDLQKKDSIFLLKMTYLYVIEKFHNNKRIPLNLISYVDVPSGSGVGSSSSLVVAILGGLFAFINKKISKISIAKHAFYIERVLCNLSGGRQDQYAAVYGGFNSIYFNTDDSVNVKKIKLNKSFINDLNEKLLLFYIGASRESSRIIDEQVKNIQSMDKVSLSATHNLKKLSFDLLESLRSEDIQYFFKLMEKSWMNKIKIAKSITNSSINHVCNISRKNKAEFVKVSGAGGGGFVLIGFEIENKYKLINALKNKNGKFFIFNFANEGLQVSVTS